MQEITLGSHTRGRQKTTWMDRGRHTGLVIHSESSGDSSFMVWPSRGMRMFEGNARQVHQYTSPSTTNRPSNDWGS